MSIGARIVAVVLWVQLVLVATSVASSSPLFVDDFEAYAAGSTLAGQGGWAGGPDALLIDDASVLLTNVLGGATSAGASESFLYHAIAGLALPPVVVMSFDAVAVSGSHNSSAGLGDPAVTISAQLGWVYSSAGPDVGWLFELRLPGLAYAFFNAGVAIDTPGHFQVVVDRGANEVWGTYNLGGGAASTPHFAVTPASLSGLGGVITHQDLRGTRGIDLDNVRVEAVPEPLTLSLTATGLIVAVLRRRRAK